MEYDWILEVSSRYPLLRRIVLVEEIHGCEGGWYGDPATPWVYQGDLVEFLPPMEMRKTLGRRGLDVGIWVQRREERFVKEGGLVCLGMDDA